MKSTVASHLGSRGTENSPWDGSQSRTAEVRILMSLVHDAAMPLSSFSKRMAMLSTHNTSLMICLRELMASRTYGFISVFNPRLFSSPGQSLSSSS